jgi:hypothetical protein
MIQSPGSPAHAAVERLVRALQNHHQTPRSKQCLPQLVATLDLAIAAANDLARAGLAFDAKVHDTLNGWRKGMQIEAEFLRGLLQYSTPLGRALVTKALSDTGRHRQHGGALLVGLVPTKAHERLDPRHRATSELENAFQAWWQQEMAAKRDPAAGLVEFFLGFGTGAERPSARSMPADVLASRRILFDAGRAHAFYTERDGLVVRYNGAFHDKETSSVRAVTSVHRRPYTSTQGTQGSGAAKRTGDDFLGGDTYAISPDGDMHTWNPQTIHSEYLSGAAVQCAGLIVVVDGKVRAIDNRSGHYQPGWANLLQAVALVEEHGAFAAEAIVGLVVDGETTMYFAVADFLSLGRRAFPFVETVAVVRTYQQRYRGRIPVPDSKLEHIPAQARQGWHGLDNQWDRFLQRFFVRKPAGGGTGDGWPTAPKAR